MKKKASNSLKVVPALVARTQLGQILNRVRKNRERFVVDKRGEPQAVIMNVEEYLLHFAKMPEALAEIQKEAKAKKLNRLSLREINLEIRNNRRERRNGNDSSGGAGGGAGQAVTGKTLRRSG